MVKERTAKEQKAIDHYAVHRSKVDAYRHAYSTKNMVPRTVYRRSADLFNRPHMARVINEIIDKASKDAGIDAAWVLKRAALLADFNLYSFIKTDDKGNAVYDFSAATDDDWYCISEYVVDTISKNDGDETFNVDRLKLKTFDKLKALELVGKHITVQAFNEKSTVEVVDRAGILAKARKRAGK